MDTQSHKRNTGGRLRNRAVEDRGDQAPARYDISGSPQDLFPERDHKLEGKIT